MKKRILTIVAGLFLASAAVQAEQLTDEETPKHEFSISYGMAPYTSIRDGFASIMSGVFISVITGKAEIENKETWGVINADYNYHVLPWLALGANMSYSSIKGDVVQDTKKGEDKETFITLMANVKLDWYRRKHFTLYSRFSGGLLFESEKVTAGSKSETRNESSFMGQVSPIGFEIGSQNIRYFSELGFGQAGVINAGIRARF